MFVRVTIFSCLLVGLGPSCDDGHAHGEEETGTQNPCLEDTRGDTFSVGLSRTGQSATVTFVDAMPAPPSKGDNIWHVSVTDEAGMPISDVEIEAIPFMPDHGHGTPVASFTEVVPDAEGEYMLKDVNMFMAGLWEVELLLTMPDETEDSVVFSFCIDP